MSTSIQEAPGREEWPHRRHRRDDAFYLETGHACFAKRPSRPFPPPYAAPRADGPSTSLRPPHGERWHGPWVDGERMRGVTNGDDALLAAERYIGVNDGVGAWATRPHGHAALWSRLILHYWAREIDREWHAATACHQPDPTECLQRAYERTIQVTSAPPPPPWQGTTTACTALVGTDRHDGRRPVLYATNLGDSQLLVLRPRDEAVVYKTVEQWHWFDCPRQLGTNSPDTPRQHAVTDRVPIEEDDVLLAMSDGVTDNLWEHEVVRNVLGSLHEWEEHGCATHAVRGPPGRMTLVAENLVDAARTIAQDPFAESPFMERAVEEGLALEGGQWTTPSPDIHHVAECATGKLDDISVVAAVCRRRAST